MCIMTCTKMWVDQKDQIVYVPRGWRKHYKGLTREEFEATRDLLSGTVTLPDGTEFQAPFKCVPFVYAAYRQDRPQRRIEIKDGNYVRKIS